MTCSTVFLTPFLLLCGMHVHSIQDPSHGALMFNDETGYPSWCLILSSFMMPASVIFHFTRFKCAKLSRFALMMLCLSHFMNHHQSKFLRESDEFHHPIYFRSFENNNILLNTTVTASAINASFDTDSFPIIIDSGASCTSTPHESDFS